MKLIWDRLHTWLRANAPLVYGDLRPGASEKKIRATEVALGVQLPDDVKACYRIHDGQRPANRRGSVRSFLDCHEWHSLEDIVASWKVWKKLLDDGIFAGRRWPAERGVRSDWFHPGWVPVASGTWCEVFLDLVPTRGGRVGQVLELVRDPPSRDVLADSFTEWLTWFADDLEDGTYAWSDEYDGIVEIELIDEQGDEE
jgi:cell wall assembly regulator SMI1